LPAVLALTALGTCVIAGSQARAASIGNLFRGNISTGNGSYLAHLPVPRVQPAVNPVVHVPPANHPHPGGGSK
jgi:hypothetical protein